MSEHSHVRSPSCPFMRELVQQTSSLPFMTPLSQDRENLRPVWLGWISMVHIDTAAVAKGETVGAAL